MMLPVGRDADAFPQRNKSFFGRCGLFETQFDEFCAWHHVRTDAFFLFNVSLSWQTIIIKAEWIENRKSRHALKAGGDIGVGV